MSKETINILTNKEVLSINQDSLGVQGFKFSVKDSVETWFKPLNNGDWAVCFLNRSKAVRSVDFNWSAQPVTDDISKRRLDTGTAVFSIKDVWTNKKLGTTKSTIKATVPGHDVLLLRLSKA